MAINDPASIHLSQDNKFDPFPTDQAFQEFFGLKTSRLSHLRGINEAQSNTYFYTCLLKRVINTSQKSISIEHSKHRNSYGFRAGVFRSSQANGIEHRNANLAFV